MYTDKRMIPHQNGSVTHNGGYRDQPSETDSPPSTERAAWIQVSNALRRRENPVSLTSTQAAILLAYAAYANPDGTSIYPSKKTIAHDTRFDKRTVTRVTNALLEAGFLIVDSEKPTQRTYIDGHLVRTRVYRIDYSTLEVDTPADQPQGVDEPKGHTVHTGVTHSPHRGDTVSPNHSLYQSIDQSSSEEESIDQEYEELCRDIAKERLEATPTKVTSPKHWIETVRRDPSVIAEARGRYAEEQHRLEHAACERCEGDAWPDCAGPYTKAELAAADDIREAQATEERARAAGWHGFRALPDKPGTCSRDDCGEAFDAKIHNAEAMAAA